MTSAIKAVKGDTLPALQVTVTRADLVRYAGASLDFNPIHWSDRVAGEVGLPGVIAHGMLTMALATRLVVEWVQDPGAIIECSARFTRPVVVPDDALGATLDITGRISEITEDRIATISLTVTCAGQSVLGKATAKVRLS